jgi:hypothetical protein
MSRADLHNALVLDRELYDASQVDPSLLDPIVRPVGNLPGPVRPFAVLRAYQGPRGGYAEHFVLSDPDGVERYRSEVRRIELTGEMFEDRFVTTVRDLVLDSYAEHTVTFFVDHEEVGAIPVFLEAALGGDPRVASEETLKKALTKGEIIWVGVPQPQADRGWRRRRPRTAEHTQAVWFVYDDGKVYVLNGPREQQVPGLETAERVTLIARSKDHRSEVSKVPARARVVDPAEDTWERVAKTAVTKRLNLADLQQAVERWRETCVLVELEPQLPESRVGAATTAGATETGAPPADAAAPAADAAPAAEPEVKIEPEIDQETYDQLIAEGKSERMARAKAKAAYMRKEKARLLAERDASG